MADEIEVTFDSDMPSIEAEVESNLPEVEATFDSSIPEIEADISSRLPDIEADFSINISNTDHSILRNRDLPDQHPIGAITGLQEALDKTNTFVYEQGVASATWTITHNLDKRPSVTVVDSAGSVITPAVTYIDNNTCIVEINGATTGYAYLN